jgi:hypothetical protein
MSAGFDEVEAWRQFAKRRTFAKLIASVDSLMLAASAVALLHS